MIYVPKLCSCKILMFSIMILCFDADLIISCYLCTFSTKMLKKCQNYRFRLQKGVKLKTDTGKNPRPQNCGYLFMSVFSQT